MKPLSFALICLVATAAISLSWNVRQVSQTHANFSRVEELVSNVESNAAFEQRLARSSDPAELRRMALVQREKARDARHVAALLGTSSRMTAIVALVGSGHVLAVSLAAAVFHFLAGRRLRPRTVTPVQVDGA